MVAAFIVNYNMPERADSLFEYLKAHTNYPTDVYLIDNGSDLVSPAKNTNVSIEKNCQTTGGWLKGLEAADSKGKYEYYMFIITSARFVEESGLLVDTLLTNFDDPNVVGVHPSLTKESTTYWNHLKNTGLNHPRQTWMIDNICSIFRADWFNSIGRFDKDFIYAHGIDLETCYKARIQGKKLIVDERVQVEKITDIGYTMNRMGMTAEQRGSLAYQNTKEVMTRKYGENWRNLMLNEEPYLKSFGEQ